VASKAETDAVSNLLEAGVPQAALAVYGRWWQLETYLREVVYTELRAAFGVRWVKHVGDKTAAWAERDRVNAYMASADADEILAYAEVRDLFELIERHWNLFEPVLLPRTRWQGLVDLLLAIRNRSAHCRRPHGDDLGRLEQVLRDLEPGARKFYGSYCRSRPVERKSKDPLARDWIGLRHDAEARLVEHCHRKYGTQFRLEYSVRPWAEGPRDVDTISGTAGLLWHAHWALGEEAEPVEAWRTLGREVRELVAHMIFNGVPVEATFAAVDDEKAIADAIGQIFDRLIPASQSLRPKPDARGADVVASKDQVATEAVVPRRFGDALGI